MTIRVLLADDHTMLRDGLKRVLESESDIKVVGVAGDGQAAVAECGRLKPDVITMDISMPILDGVEATRHVLRTQPEARVIILSMYGSSEHVYQVLHAGARGYVLKESAGAEVLAAVRAVHAGRRYLCKRVSEMVFNQFALSHDNSPIDSLSAREREVLKLVVDGHRNVEIAGALSISVKSVETYRSRLMQKLGIHDVPTLVKFALVHGVTQLK